MRYLIYKLAFTGSVRFGADHSGAGLARAAMVCHADTWYSALCSEAAAWQGEAGPAKLQAWLNSGQLRFSDLLPYEQAKLFLPKPLLNISAPKNERPNVADVKAAAVKRKTFKRITHIAADEMDSYVKAMQHGKEGALTIPQLGEASLVQKVNVRQEEPLPYHVAAYSFYPQAGLYCIAAVGPDVDEAWLTSLIEMLGHSGIGGKRSSGYGRFVLADGQKCPGYLQNMLQAKKAHRQMALSVFCPAADEIAILQEGYYLLTRRAGFVNSPGYSQTAVKRNAIYMVLPGACVRRRLQGMTIDTATADAPHPVYRYGHGLFVGVNL